ncbi:thiamine pyrophosphate-binding protein [Nocardioides humi]|uniref:Thiamine pyrophosphate-binding protein n=1 Tax=Nocardioides humi TaxID=449461 RepID=A0ABN1ZWI4_9ACTN|nr:thiamine pyrophosphate-binding protein [Nocardioides humi]
MLLHEAVGRALVAHGVDTMFGLVGDGNLFVVDSYVRHAGGRYVGATHEANAVHMAHGYAVLSDRIGVATVTHGPGVTNTLTALVEARKAAVPLVLVCGDTDSLDRDGPQVIGQRDLVLPTGAGVEQVRSAQTALEDLSTALRRARTERRPVVLNLPAELVHAEVDFVDQRVELPAEARLALDDGQLDIAVGMLASAQRPLILAGRGARGAATSLSALAARIGAPVATTLGAKDLFRDDEANLGIFGTLASPAGLDAITKADCVFAFGASLNRYTTVKGSLLADKTVIHCDLDVGRLGRLAEIDAAVVGDAGDVAETVVAWLNEAEIPSSSFRATIFAEGSRDREESLLAMPVAGGGRVAEGGRVDVRTALRAIDAAVERDRTFVTDAGRYLAVAWPEVHVDHPDHFLFTVSFGAIGTGVGSAIGAALARPDHPALLVCGDGGLMLGGLAELSTVSRLGLDLVVVVCNDSAYGAEYVQLAGADLSPGLTEFSWPSFEALAGAMGFEAITVNDAEDLGTAVERIRARTGPMLVDIKLDPAAMPDVAH